MEAVKQPPNIHGTVHSSTGITHPRIVPRDEDLRRAADVLNGGSKVAMLVGAGALGATDEVLEVADVLGAGIAKALLGKATVPDDYPFVTGAIGLLGTRASYDMMTGCDTLLMVGSSFPYSEFLPSGKARGVQIDIDARMIGIRYPMEVNLVGDSGETLRALLPLLQRKSDRTWRDTIETECLRLVAPARSARHDRCESGQPAARVLGTVIATSRRVPARRRIQAQLQAGMRAISSSGAA